MDYYAAKVSDVLKELKSSKNGLTDKEAKKRLLKYGANELEKAKGTTALKIFLDQFKNGLILLLIFAGILSLFLKQNVEAVAIYFIVLLNAILGFVQEYRAEKALEELKKMSAPTAKVLRHGKEMKVPAKEIVPGDILMLEAGDIVAADSRLIEVSSLKIDEASLTGESVPSKKVINSFKPGTSVADQENMAFMGTVVTYGKGKSVVTGTGMKTEFGKIATSLQTTKTVKTPLQIKFEQLAKQLGIIAVSLVVILFIVGVLQGSFSFSEMVLFALAVTVSTVPNSLPLVVTVGLSLGTKKLAKHNMLIKKLPAAESLGAVTIICSDKTGTITKNQMTVTKVFYNNQVIDVSGAGYNPTGNFSVSGKQINAKRLELLLRIGYLCNNAELVKNEGKFDIIGDPTEGSLVVLGRKGKFDDKNFLLIDELPFDSDRKRMTVIFNNKINKKKEAYVKGAPDLLLKFCTKIIENGKVRKITKKDKQRILKMNNGFAKDALRVLGFAYRDVSNLKKYSITSVEKDLVFVGLVGMIDPPRKEIKKAVSQCKNAGIDVMVITGDHAITTQAVAKQVGLFSKGDIILTGEEIENMNDEELIKQIDQVRIVARALPIQKLRIVNALQKKGHIVAMTGDGVNDAPALKKSDIGIAMGITGTDVAKEVSEATLVDDNFASIVRAIGVGRDIYNKMIKSAKYLLSCNGGEITSVFIAIMLKFPLPLLPLQILLMSILTDDFPALGLGLESAEEGIMDQKPRDPKEKPLTSRIVLSIVIFGLIMGLGTLFMFVQYKNIDLSKAQTVAFTTLVMFQMFAVISSRTLHSSLKHLNPFSNMWLFGAVCLSIIIQLLVVYVPFLQTVFGTTSLLLVDWIKIVGIASLGFIMMELSKIIGFRKKSVVTA